ncbi:RidA family protein [Robertmurraya massiliosenegalensis]|uniref:RidA family protein n=1 Tax=Robertmurraya massiliosenegalensis TaxID=1287657 RepID=UPI0002FE09F6|nr:RidA family protein [Robertmurraya massiliosenegalensis]
MRAIFTKQAPSAIGPYSQAIKANNLLFVSGQLPVDPITGNLVEPNVIIQVSQVLKNISAILEAEELTLEHVIKTTIFVNDMEHFNLINEEYGKYFTKHQPARATVEVSRLPKDALVEIEVIATYEI